MPLSKETRDRIERDALRKSSIADIQQGYIAGAEAEAERAQGLIECLKEVRKYFPDPTNYARIIDQALTKYNNSK